MVCHCLQFRVVILLVFLFGSTALAQQTAELKPSLTESRDDPFSLDMNSLLNLKITTASKFSEKLTEAAAVVSVVTKDELQRFGGFTLRQILERVAGLNGSTSQFIDRSIIAVRGDQTHADGGHVLILINGRPTREGGLGGIGSDILESFPVKVLERIEVVKGPGSVLYGSDAFSGVINLITRKADGIEVDLSSASAGGGGQAQTAQILVAQGQLKVVAAGQFHNKTNLPNSYKFFDSNPFSRTNGSTLLTDSNLREQGAGAYLGINYKHLSFMSNFTEFEAPSFSGGIVGTVRWKRGFADVGYTLDATKNWQMNFNLTYTRGVIRAAKFPDAGGDASEVVTEWTNFVTLGENDRLTFGALNDNIYGNGTYYGVIPNVALYKGSRNGLGFYAQHEHRLTDDFKVIGGVQANKNGRISFDLVPRVGLIWNPIHQITFKALYGKAFRAPNLVELLVDFPTIKGNNKLTPEKVGTLDFGIAYQSNHLQASVNYFHSRQSSQIVADSSVFPIQFINQGNALFQGFESEAKYYWQKNWLLLASTVYQTNSDGTGKRNVTPIPNHSAKLGISYLAENGVTLSMFDVYQGRIDGYSSSLNPIPAATHMISAHARLDLTRRWLKYSRSGIAVFAQADNLLNHSVWLPNWGYGGVDTIPAHNRRSIYFGVEVWIKGE